MTNFTAKLFAVALAVAGVVGINPTTASAGGHHGHHGHSSHSIHFTGHSGHGHFTPRLSRYWIPGHYVILDCGARIYKPGYWKISYGSHHGHGW